jgi:hypothetical protein
MRSLPRSTPPSAQAWNARSRGSRKNAAAIIHRRLVGMPDELAGLCKLRVGDWRIL